MLTKLDEYYKIEEENLIGIFPPQTTPSNSAVSIPLIPLGSIDPSILINPKRVGEPSYDLSPLGKLVLKNYKNGQIPLDKMTSIGPGANTSYYPDGKFRLFPKAADAWFKWKKEMDDNNIKYLLSSAYRSTSHQSNLPKSTTVSSPGNSPHGLGGALDFSNLRQLVGGSDNLIKNANARKLFPIYKQISEIGVKYGWYNPYRLSNNWGQNEIWHFEYWGEI